MEVLSSLSTTILLEIDLSYNDEGVPSNYWYTTFFQEAAVETLIEAELECVTLILVVVVNYSNSSSTDSYYKTNHLASCSY